MSKSYDIVVIGAGLSSLMFLSRYILKNKDQSILLIEKSIKKKVSYKNISYPKNYPQIEPQRRCPDIQKLKNELKFSGNVSLNDAINRFYLWTKKYY